MSIEQGQDRSAGASGVEQRAIVGAHTPGPWVSILAVIAFWRFKRSLTRSERLRLAYWGATGNPKHEDVGARYGYR